FLRLVGRAPRRDRQLPPLRNYFQLVLAEFGIGGVRFASVADAIDMSAARSERAAVFHDPSGLLEVRALDPDSVSDLEERSGLVLGRHCAALHFRRDHGATPRIRSDSL